ncbi:Pr6Pr family membrane protein [Nocardioides sp. KIGAM211]|uniref:Pr6Pr family membrane protein n=1 Tax=Nocardioides luti TaxID=2761101 RepID=A0A7X0RE60_9ACTN|nr:Pr6Pr family membrane protein [Nocardioides luti]MBB6626662.1 Pr6Pr family membrane protein [Nocardioides luti]
MSHSWARRWHLVTAVVAVAALLLQLVLVVSGSAVLAEQDPPGLALRLGRFASYFTIQSNLLVAVAAITLARDPARDGAGWRVLRLAGVVGIAVTGLVHFVLLRPLLDLDGADYVADKLLHVAVPLLAVVGWVLLGPRPRASVRTAALALLWPLAWLAWTLAVGALSGWYPYPFLDPAEDGAGAVVVACLGITVLVVAFFGAALAVDRRAAPAPRN